MDSTFSRKKAFTLTELIFLLAGVVIVALGFILPAMGKTKAKGRGLNCVNNLKQIGLSHRLFANDHNDKYPTQESTNEGGSLEYVSTGQTFQHFVVLSNELGTPKILVCPQDSARTAAPSIPWMHNGNLSYFINLDAAEENGNEWLAGDRNLDHSVEARNFSFPFTSNTVVRWQKTIHFATAKKEAGNVAFSDSSVQQLNGKALQQSLKQSARTNRISIP